MADAQEPDDVKDPNEPDFSTLEEETPEAPKDPSPKEAKAEEKPEGKEEPKAEEAEEKPKEEKETEAEEGDKPPEGEETDTSDKKEEEKPSKADERKTELNLEIRDLVARRNALRKDVEGKNAEIYAPAAEKELLDQVNPETGEKYTSVEAKVEAMRQSTEMDRYNNQIAESQLLIGRESERVLMDFPIFNPDSETFDKELAEEAASLLDSNLIRDENSGMIVGSNVSPYQLYKTIARAAGVSAAKGQIKGQQAAEKMLANADPSTNNAPPKEKADPIMETLKNWDDD